MAALDVTKVVIKPTLRTMVEFEPAVLEPDHYEIVATPQEDEPTPVSVTGTSTLLTMGPLRKGVTYDIQVHAHYADPEDEEVGAIYEATITIQAGYSAILRQKLYDIVSAASLGMGGRSLTILADAYGRPRSIRENEPITSRMPLLEIRIPALAGTQMASGVRRTEVYQVDMLLAEAAHDSDQAMERLQLLSDQLRNAVDSQLNLQLQNFGVIDQSWSWSNVGDPLDEDKLQAVTLRLSIPIQAIIGQLPLS